MMEAKIRFRSENGVIKITNFSFLRCSIFAISNFCQRIYNPYCNTTNVLNPFWSRPADLFLIVT